MKFPGLFLLLCVSWLTSARAGEMALPDLHPTREIATDVKDVPFLSGALEVPPWATNNEGILNGQITPGVTHVQIGTYWRPLEPQKDRWDWKGLDDVIAESHKRRLKVAILAVQMFAPAWFQRTPDYMTLTEMTTGATVDFLSPWAPGTETAYAHFFEALARHYSHDEIDVIDFCYPGSDFGEVGLTIGGGNFLPGGNAHAHFPQNPGAWKPGFWCGDAYARADFRKRMLEKYGSVKEIADAWGCNIDKPEDIGFPDPAKRAGQRRRWVDFISWIQQSQSRNLVKYLEIVRKYFPHTLLNVPMGFGSDEATYGCDRTGVPMAVKGLEPIVIRSTHAGFNRGRWPLAYWFYKRMAPVARSLGEGFGVEPPGGDLSAAEVRREIFEDASAGVDFVYEYYQNFHAFPDVIGAFKKALRPQERSLVDIGVLFPSTEMMINNSGFPPGQIEFCDSGREYFDYDVVDENMLGWDMLKNYKVLLHTSGAVFREGSLPAIGKWLKSGGVLITCGAPRWEDITGGTDTAAAWMTNEVTSAKIPNVHLYKVGNGRLYAVTAGKRDDYLPIVVSILNTMNATRVLHGFDGRDDGKYITDFPDGRLIFDETTMETRFVPKSQ
jgi:hypothetical protein